MKQFKLILVLITVIALTSCNSSGDAAVEKILVVEQIQANVKDDMCGDCLVNKYKYRVKLKSYSGDIFYYTDYKHEVKDTLVSIFEFTDNREKVIIGKDVDIKAIKLKVDSTMEVNAKLQKKNDELALYNELLMGIIQENAKK